MPLHRFPQRPRRSKELAVFERAINAAGLVLWSSDPSGACIYMSEHWSKLTGHPMKGVLGEGWQRFVHPEDRAREFPSFARALERREPMTAEYRLRRADGAYFWVRDHGAPLFQNGRFRGYVGTLLEIDERKRLEEEARLAHERFSLAVRASNDGIWDWDLQNNKGYMSERCAELMGYPAAEVAARYVSLVHPGDRRRLHTSLQSHYEQQVPYDVEYRWRTPKGYRWMRTTGQAVWDRDGQPVRIVGSTSDIDDRKRAERRVVLLNNRLTQSNAALKTLTQRLLEATEAERSRVARELHDDLIQNLAYLQMRVALLAQMPSAAQQPLVEIEKLVEKTADSVRRMARDLHSSVLDDLGLERALRSFCADLQPAGKLRVVVRRRGRIAEPPSAIGLSLYRVAQEAVRNALRHSGADSATITLNGGPNFLRLRIEDRGRGFDPVSIKAGLGLTSMAERMRLAGGSLRVVARPGKGTMVEASIEWR